jgi:hypothetical protein
MEEEGDTIMKIDKPRRIVTMVRKSLVRFKKLIIQELKRWDLTHSHFSWEKFYFISNLFSNKITNSI